MSILADWQIRELCTGDKPMLSPFHNEKVRFTKEGHRVPSYGLSSYGYDISLSDKDLKVFTDLHSSVIDPRKIDSKIYTSPIIRKDEDDGALYILLPPHGFLLGHTLEWFDMPNDVLGNCLGKSTYARGAISVIVTPSEPGWKGNLVVEVVNNANLPARIYLNCGIAQMLFFRGEPCEKDYGDGKYTMQVGTTDAIA